MPLNKKKLILNTVSVSLGCKKLKLSSFLDPKPRSRPSPPSSSELGRDIGMDKETKCLRATVRGFGRVGGESLAVEKESDDPYLDFRYSMLQMILEKEICSKDDLKELLNCFLKLNSPYYHGIIVRAFSDIWNGVFSINPAADHPLKPLYI
ncbi:Transcription repressor OFP6 [Hibiscus syriacus]|uniref:Transcription repressor n=1 Tax=Hibiscus syriacus TaxID=106335 RepID=A0A6A3AEI2_HIBSY|nr:transcription repressor OFP6-like [Hibiscus syriacus]KAE8702516.1 Transcription repressor OFP6 [Hibiscus syriacus]